MSDSDKPTKIQDPNVEPVGPKPPTSAEELAEKRGTTEASSSGGKGGSVAVGAQRTTREFRKYVVGMLLLGLSLGLASMLLFLLLCDLGNCECGLCGVMKRSFPWTLLTALISAPSLILTWIWREKHKREDVAAAQEQVRIGQLQVTVAENGQVTERFTRAIEHLGHTTSVAIRLGGIYALERIMKDSARDHWTIVETLAAFIRVQSPLRPPGEKDMEDADTEDEPRIDRLPIDVQAALTVIARRNATNDPEDERINLDQTFLVGSDLQGGNLSRCQLFEADLRGAQLRGANLVGAYLQGANLHRADLRKANLAEAILGLANCRQARLTNANLRGVFAANADFPVITWNGEYLL